MNVRSSKIIVIQLIQSVLILKEVITVLVCLVIRFERFFFFSEKILY